MLYAPHRTFRILIGDGPLVSTDLVSLADAVPEQFGKQGHKILTAAREAELLYCEWQASVVVIRYYQRKENRVLTEKSVE